MLRTQGAEGHLPHTIPKEFDYEPRRVEGQLDEAVYYTTRLLQEMRATHAY